jgi:energy-coupling factor transporter transmembrane protein EcfT
MIVVSKFEKLYLLRNVFIPIICIGLSVLLVDVKIYYKKEADVFFPVIFLLILGCLVLFYNLSSIYKIIVEEKTITKIYFLSRKTEIISYMSIKSSEKEFVDGSYSTEVGQITPGYYRYVLNLEKNKKLIVSPLYFKNCNQLIAEINLRIGSSVSEAS